METGTTLTGRLRSGPSRLLQEEFLEPQFRFELEHLVPYYLLAERVLLVEYRRMGVLDDAQTQAIAVALREAVSGGLVADHRANLADISFAIEQRVLASLTVPAPAWHVDRSRNDLQAAAQLLFGRDELRRCADAALKFGRAAHAVARAYTEMPMPGYTHLQAAQVISPGFYLAAVADQTLLALRRMLGADDDINLCPLGGGAICGQELPWDRERMAFLTGCAGPQRHALNAVASRSWATIISGELSNFAVAASRFATDLMAWASEAYQFLELPDELAGISSAMPQKKNYPVLERARGRTAHVSALAYDIVVASRNTSYSNSVEAAKEAGRYFHAACDAFCSALRLLTAVVSAARFRSDRMRAACERSYLGGLTLANDLTLRCHVPWRTAQVIAGEYIRAALTRGIPPGTPNALLLRQVSEEHGYAAGDDAEKALREAFDIDHALYRTSSSGSAHPQAVRALLNSQEEEFAQVAADLASRRRRAAACAAEVDRLLAAEDTSDPARKR